MKDVMERLYKNNVGRLPVVERDDPKKVVGIVTRTDAIAAYEVLSREGARRER
jgi:CIC family chloride channel protein